MRQIIAAWIICTLSAISAQAAETITGEYTTKQPSLSGIMLVKQLPDKRIKFEINTVKRGGGDYKGNATTCTAEGIAEMQSDGTAVYIIKEDYMENPFKVVLSLGKKQITVESNADETGQCGRGAWIDGKYLKKNSKVPKFSE